MTLEGKALFAYADRFARRQEKRGKGTRYPTVRQAAKRFKVPQSVVVDTVEGSYIDGVYFALSTGVGISGAGCANLEGGDQLIEAYR